ncbi:MAG: helix-turn-helix transcriptional regulator [Clostridia bacterium]|nr:helix-turn-helix transcriptional regulator [Clostridia bacterium]
MTKETARRLAALRSSRGYTQESLAGMLGLSRQSISKWERAEASPDIDNLIALAKLYGISVDEILGLSAPEHARKEADEPAAPEKKPDFPGTIDPLDPEKEPDPLRERPTELPEPTPEPGEERVTEVPPITSPETPAIFPDDPDVVRAFSKEAVPPEQADFPADEAVHTPVPSPEENTADDTILPREEDAANENEGEGKGTDADEDENEDKTPEPSPAPEKLHPFHLLPVGLIALGAFCTVGLLTKNWHPAWILLFLFPLYHSLVEAAVRREPFFFFFPMIPLGVYLWLGFSFGAWIAALPLFFTVPIYYAFCFFFHRLRKQASR